MHRTVASANPPLRGQRSKASMPWDNEGALNDLSSSRTERPSACTSIPEQYPPPTEVAETRSRRGESVVHQPARAAEQGSPSVRLEHAEGSTTVASTVGDRAEV